MRHHFLSAVLAAFIVCIGSLATRADTFVEDFNAGILPERWDIFTFAADGAPWTVSAPDAEGRLRISKPADSDTSTYYHELDGAITSKFTVGGDFAISVDFDLLEFPAGPTAGANHAFLRVFTGGAYFEVNRFVSAGGNGAGVFSNVASDPGGVADSTIHGRLGLSREGQTLSGWIDGGAGMVLLGSVSSPQFLTPMNVQLFAAQVPNGGVSEPRPNSALDVRFDNLVIVPEPATLSLLMLGGLAVLRRRQA